MGQPGLYKDEKLIASWNELLKDKSIIVMEADLYSCRTSESGILVLPNGIVTIDDVAFENANFSEVILPEVLRDIGFGAFQNSKIERIIIPKGVYNIRQDTFLSCKNLKEADIG